MSWVETGKIIANSPKLVVRASFGKFVTFPGNKDYKPGDKVKLARTPCGICKLVEDEHAPTTPEPPEPEKIKNFNYEKLEYPDTIDPNN